MTHVMHCDQPSTPVNRVDHSILPNANPVKTLRPRKLHAVSRKWLTLQPIDSTKDPADHFHRNRAQVLLH
jgi:hypothetical protein